MAVMIPVNSTALSVVVLNALQILKAVFFSGDSGLQVMLKLEWIAPLRLKAVSDSVSVRQSAIFFQVLPWPFDIHTQDVP